MATERVVEVVSGDVRTRAETGSQDHGIDGRPAKRIERREGPQLGRRGGRRRSIAGLMRKGSGHGCESVKQLEIALGDGRVGVGGLHHVCELGKSSSSSGNTGLHAQPLVDEVGASTCLDLLKTRERW